MELNQIRYFNVLARELHFTRAADLCNVSQPALTKAIQKLEGELGGTLFLRQRSRTQLTDLGRAVRPSLERAWDAAREAKEQAEAFHHRDNSPLRIGLELSIPANVLTPVIAELYRNFSDIQLSVSQDTQANLSERLLLGEIDAALLVAGDAVPERLHRWKLYQENYIVMCPQDHSFVQRDAIDIQDLTEECLLMLENAACPVRQLISMLCLQHGLKPRRQHFLSSLEQISEMVQASLGVAIAGDRMQTATPMIRRPMTPDPGPRTIVLSVAAGHPLGPTPGLFLKLMRARSWLDPAPMFQAATHQALAH